MKNLMKQFTIILCLIVLPIIAKSQKSSEKVLIDQVVAVVGSNVILYSEIENEFINVTGGAIQHACTKSKTNKCKNYKFKYK